MVRYSEDAFFEAQSQRRMSSSGLKSISLALRPRLGSLLRPSKQTSRRNGSGASTPRTSIPAIFFSLPLEIRQQIYLEILVSPHPTIGDPSYHPIPVRTRKIPEIEYKAWWKYNPWWGTEEMSRLLRVNRRIYHEASYLLYTTFKFFLPDCWNPKIARSLIDPLPIHSRELIRSLMLNVALHTGVGDHPRDPKLKPDQRKQAFALLVDNLPSLRRVELQIYFVGVDPVKEADRKYLLDTLIGIVRIFKGIETVELVNAEMGVVNGRKRAGVVEECWELLNEEKW